MTEKEELGIELAKKIIGLSHSCNMEKLNEVELSRLNEVVSIARTMFVSSDEYDKNDDDKSFL